MRLLACTLRWIVTVILVCIGAAGEIGIMGFGMSHEVTWMWFAFAFGGAILWIYGIAIIAVKVCPLWDL